MRILVEVSSIGDQLTNYPGNERTDTWDSKMGSTVVHDICRGFVDRNQVSTGHFVYNCRQCSLRIPVPMTFWDGTWEQFRRYMKGVIS